MIWEPARSPSGSLVSYADRTAYVWRNGIRINFGNSKLGFRRFIRGKKK